MWKRHRDFLVFALLVSALWSVPSYADDNSCFIAALDQNDVWVIIYDEDNDGNRGKILFEGKIPAGQKIKITSSVGHIRYQFKIQKDQPYQGDVDVDCFQKNTILIE